MGGKLDLSEMTKFYKSPKPGEKKNPPEETSNRTREARLTQEIHLKTITRF